MTIFLNWWSNHDVEDSGCVRDEELPDCHAYMRWEDVVEALLGPESRNEPIKEKNKERILSGIVQITHKYSHNLGTGFYISKNLLLTSAHVVKDRQFVGIRDLSDDTARWPERILAPSFRPPVPLYDGLVIASDKRRDLALIHVTKEGNPRSLFCGELPLDASVRAIGHPEIGFPFSITSGRVNSVGIFGLPIKRGVLAIQTDAALNSKNSGGASDTC